MNNNFKVNYILIAFVHSPLTASERVFDHLTVEESNATLQEELYGLDPLQNGSVLGIFYYFIIFYFLSMISLKILK